MNAQPSASTWLPETNFSDRIKLLIERIGSATQIARMCGFSEGVVRSWRDGHTDPSRARCVTLARTLGISLMWLVAGEGSILTDPIVTTQGDQRTAMTFSPYAVPIGMMPTTETGVDTQRLTTAMRLLQSELDLTNSSMSLAENSDMLAQLYEIIGPAGVHADTSAIVEFNHRLAIRIKDTGTVA